ncbi:MAG: glycosyltransferase family 2 protein [Gammaproteobacteria bacterium]|nr:glycosyltransferase family 2 protein [Gammaproteobacteria bacterium]
MKLSIVATLYKSSVYIPEFYRRASAVARQLVDEDYEIVLVNDGSPDGDFDIAVEFAKNDQHVVVVDLSRNFGHHKAMMTGLAYARGQQVFLIDSDLEEDPEWLLSFERQMQDEVSDVVFGVQSKRRGGVIEQATGSIFYRLFRILSGISQPNNIVTARLMSRRYVDALLLHQERELNIGGLWVITGFKQCSQIVEKRSMSPTTYSFSRKLSHFVNAVTSFSSLPLVFTFYSGLLISISAAVFIVYLIIKYLFIASPPDGYTSVIASIWLFSGLIIFFVGVQGIYISKVFSEVKQRPYTIVRDVYKRTQEQKLQ